MTREDLEKIVKEVTDEVNVHSFYGRTYENVISAEFWGQKADSFDNFWKWVDEEVKVVDGNLNITEVYFYSDVNINAYIQLPDWNPIDWDSWDSHIHVNIPYIANGKFTELK